VSPWKVILATMVIFGCGVVTGGLLMKTALPFPLPGRVNPEPNRAADNPPPFGQFQQPAFLKRMQKQLDLTPQQNEAVARIMKESQDRTRPLWVPIAPKLREEMRRDRQEIRAVLTPEQQVKFDELLRNRPRKNPPAQPPPPTNQF
jgi:hypothetical protein